MQELEFGVDTAFSFWREVGQAASEHKQVYIQRAETERKIVPTKQITFRLMCFPFLMQDKLP